MCTIYRGVPLIPPITDSLAINFEDPKSANLIVFESFDSKRLALLISLHIKIIFYLIKFI